MPTSSLSSASAGRSSVDLLLGSLGVSAAAVSVSFAAYMMAVGPAPRAPAGDFPVFAAFDHRSTPMGPESARDLPHTVARSRPSLPTEVDFAPTGSIAHGPRAPGLASNTQAELVSARGVPRVDGFSLRDVFDGKALVEGGNRLHLVVPGSTLEGVGQVLAVRQQGRSWVVETTAGEITK